MRHLRSEAQTVVRMVAVTLTLVALAATAIPTASQPEVTAKGRMVLAWHASLASRWVDPQEHDGTATPDNFLTAIHRILSQEAPPA